MKDDKVLLVTGASSDIGVMLIDKVAKKYNKIVAHYNSSVNEIERLERNYSDRIIPMQADFADLKSTQGLIDKIKEKELYPDHIVHLPSPKVSNLQFHKLSWNTYQNEIDTSLRSITMITQQLIPYMSKQCYGKIVFMLTSYVIGVPPKFLSSYITTKYALLGLMKSINAEYAEKGISINAISPEMVETKFLSELPDLIKEQSAKKNVMGRNLFVKEVVPTIQFLLSDDSDMISGQNIGITSGTR